MLVQGVVSNSAACTFYRPTWALDESSQKL